MRFHPALCTRPRLFSLFAICALLLVLTIESGCGAASANSPGSQFSPSMNRGPAAPSSPGLAAYAYAGTNVSGNEQGYVTNYPISNEGVSLSSSGSSVSGASGSLVVTNHFVFATDGKYIVTYTRDTSGGLQQTSSVDGTAHNITPQGSIVGPLTVDRSGQTLYAAEIEYDGTDNDAYSIWTINADGSLTFVANIGSNVDYNSYLAFTQDNRYAYGYGCYFANWDVFGLARNNDGTLTSFDSGALPPPSNDFICPSGVATSANYVVIAFIDVESQNALEQLGAYTLHDDGTLSLISNTVINTPFTGVRDIAMDPSGQYLAVSGDRGLQMYSLHADGTLAAVGPVMDSSLPFNVLKWDSSNHLYAINGIGLYIFTATSGVLSEDPGSPLPVTEGGSLAVSPAQ